MSVPDQELFEVRLIGIPVETWQRASAHQQAIQREFDILRSSLPADSIPNRLSELSDRLANRFQGFGTAPFEEMRTASERGNEHIDLVFEVPEETVEGVRQLDAMMDTVDEYCRDGDLLTLATPPDLVEFRRWFLGEFVRQIGHGEPPRSWDSFHRGGLDTSDPPRGRTGGVIGAGARDDGKIMFEGDLDLASAGLLREEIVVRRSSGATSLVIDLTRVEFIDSVGLSLLVTAFNRAREDGAELSLVLPSHLRRVFEISGLVELLDPKFEDRPSA